MGSRKRSICIVLIGAYVRCVCFTVEILFNAEVVIAHFTPLVAEERGFAIGKFNDIKGLYKVLIC